MNARSLSLPMKLAGLRRQRGFTLMEAVVVIAITGIIGAIVAVFIKLPVQGYVDSVARADMADLAQTALSRMARDIRLALPNSVRVGGANNSFLEMLPTKTGGRYLAAEDSDFVPVTSNFLQFGSGNGNCASGLCPFDVVGPAPGALPGMADPHQAINVGDSVVVYNLGEGMAPADAYDCSANCNRNLIANPPLGQRSVGGGTIFSINLEPVAGNTTAFAQQAIPMASPGQRFQVIGGPVTYFCDSFATGGSGKLYRYADYNIQATQPVQGADFTGAKMTRNILISGVDSCVFDADSLPNTHTALITLRLNLVSAVNGERVTLVQQVHVDNTP